MEQEDKNLNGIYVNRRKDLGAFHLLSSDYVASLPMLAMQLESMQFDLKLLDSWDTTVAAKGHASEHAGMLYVKHTGINRDTKGRMVVPRQEFVKENDVKTVMGFGTGYANYPSIVTLFAFTNEIISKAEMEPFSPCLKHICRSLESLLGVGSSFIN